MIIRMFLCRGWSLCFLVFVFPDAGVFFIRILLPVGVDPIGDLLRRIGQQPRRFFEKRIVERVFDPARFFRHIHTRPDAAPCAADRKVPGVGHDVIVILDDRIGVGLSALALPPQRNRRGCRPPLPSSRSCGRQRGVFPAGIQNVFRAFPAGLHPACPAEQRQSAAAQRLPHRHRYRRCLRVQQPQLFFLRFSQADRTPCEYMKKYEQR